MLNQTAQYLIRVILFIIASSFLTKCNISNQNVPFPTEETAFRKPKSEPLLFSKPQKLNWQPANPDSNKAITETTFDLNNIPEKPIDLGGFNPFLKPMQQSPLNWNSLSDSAFNLNDLPSEKLKYNISLLGTPTHIKAGIPKIKNDATTGLLTFGEENGLPNKNVNVIATDKNGIVWIATANGLCRYDGAYCDIYGKDQGLKGVAITRMFIDNDNKIWITTMDYGLEIIDLNTGLIKELSTENGLGNNSLWGFLLDNKNRAWIGSWGGGVDIIDEAAGTIKHLKQMQGLSDDRVRSFMQDKSGQIWIGAGKGVDIINEKTGKIKRLNKSNGLSDNDIEFIMEDSKGQVWIPTRNEVNILDFKARIIKHLNTTQGLNTNNTRISIEDTKGNIWIGGTAGANVINEQAGTIKMITKTAGLAGDYVASIMEDKNEQIWLGTSGAVNILNHKTGSLKHVSIKDNFNNKYVLNSTEDSDGNIWIGAEAANNNPDAEVFIVDTKRNMVKSINKDLLDNKKFVGDFMEDHNGQMWVGGFDGIDMIDHNRKSIKHLAAKNGLTNNTIISLFEDSKEQVWIGTFKGINVFNTGTGILKHITTAEGISNDTVTCFREDAKGRIWACTLKGINIIDENTGTIRQLITGKQQQDVITGLVIDENGLILAATNDGINIIDDHNESITNFSLKEGLPDPSIGFLWGNNHSIFAGTAKGLTQIRTVQPKINDTVNFDNWKTRTFDKGQGFLDVAFQNYGITTGILSKEGKFWWCLGNLLTIMDIPAEDTVISPTFITGIDIFNQPAVFNNNLLLQTKLKERDTIWAVKRDTFYTKKQLTEMQFKNIGSWDSLVPPFYLPENLQLPYYQNHITFHFTGMHTSNPGKALYRYFLEGVDKKWSAISDKPFSENYLNLSPGHYTFKVASSGFNGLWSKPAIYIFTILPPWWRTWWMYMIYAVMLVAALYAYNKYRSAALIKQNRLLEEKISLRTNQLENKKSELERSLEDLKTTQTQLIQSEKMASLGELTAGIAHEIQNPLNFVNNFSEVNTELIAEMKQEIEKGNFEEAKAIAKDIEENEQKIVFHGKRADGIVKGMLQHSRSSSGVKEPTDINALCDEYLRLSYHGLRAKDKSFNATMKTDFDNSIEKINILSQDIGRVILNLITNAFYAVAEKKKMNISGYEPVVSVTTKRSQASHSVSITVADNGNGIPRKVLDKIFQPFFTTKPAGQGTGLGLSMSYDIVTKGHGGELTADTKEGAGATFNIILPI
ncbi:sensor histidine kinase [soil metagenome]